MSLRNMMIDWFICRRLCFFRWLICFLSLFLCIVVSLLIIRELVSLSLLKFEGFIWILNSGVFVGFDVNL